MLINTKACATFLILSLLCLAPAMAADEAKPADAAPAPEAPAQETAAQPGIIAAQGVFIQSLGDRAIALLANKQLSNEERDASFRELLRNNFDLSTIARFVIGRSWQTATPEQKTEYMRLFEALVTKTYSDRFSLYTGEGFKVISTTAESEKDTIVNSAITRPDGSPATTVTWRVRQKGNTFGIIDVIVEGVSMSVTQRQEYASVIQRNGGDIEALLKVMRERVEPKAAAPAQG